MSEVPSSLSSGDSTSLGPLPPASELAAYKQIDSNLLDRILHMAELEQKQRIAMEKQALEQPYLLARRGQSFGIAALVLMVFLAGYVAFLHQFGWATLIGSLDFVAVVTVFVRGGGPKP